MAETFRLIVSTPNGQILDEQVDMLIVKTTEGELGVLRGHVDYMAAIEIGNIQVKKNGVFHVATAHDGFVRITPSQTTVLVTTCEWNEEIDLDRARRAKERAEARLAQKQGDVDLAVAEYRLKKALNRIKIADM